MTSPRNRPTRSELITVEVATLDQHNDPGHVFARAEFQSRTAAASFAVSQAAMLSAGREIDRIAATVSVRARDGAHTELPFTGTPNELAVMLSSEPGYAAGVRKAQVPAPAAVAEVIARFADSAPSRIDASPTAPDVSEVRVQSTRPEPIPDSRTVVGVYSTADATRIATAIAERVGGSVTADPGSQTLTVSHAAPIAAQEREAVERRHRIASLRANIATLDTVRDRDHVSALSGELDDLQKRMQSFEPRPDIAPMDDPAALGRSRAPVAGEPAVSSTPPSLRAVLNRQPSHPREAAPPVQSAQPRAAHDLGR
ncbi:MAG: methyltransferase [Rhodococcus sp. (in: high G+C Gram-positive bacteria)]|uniref:methyltransferase n=1 Tax=Rhodococcus sp. KRD197 TaxID=2729731 RepID=UPI0019D2FFBF|nr:methyltransferase [Rhodococcus sp. KRD197]